MEDEKPNAEGLVDTIKKSRILNDYAGAIYVLEMEEAAQVIAALERAADLERTTHETIEVHRRAALDEAIQVIAGYANRCHITGMQRMALESAAEIIRGLKGE